MDDRDGAYRSRGQSPRRPPYDGDTPPARSSSRAPREMDGSRYRQPRRDYDADADYDRSGRDPRGGSSGRHERDDYDRRPRPAGSARGERRGYDDYDRSNRYSRSDPGAPLPRGDRSMRSGRPPVRDDGRGDPRSARAGGRGPGDSSARMRRPAQPGGRGGLWGDEAQAFGGLNGRDPRARRLAGQRDVEDESDSPAAGFAKALGAIFLALVLGAGSAYGYYVVSTPKLHVAPSQQALPTTTPATPSTTPSPSATKSALIQPPAAARTLHVS